MNLGLHCTWDVYHADSQLLSYVQHVEPILHKIVDELGLTKINAAFKQFEPVGVTGFILLEESHISIHTWPEHQFAAVDVFSCQPFNADKVKALLGELLRSNDTIISREWERGQFYERNLKTAR